MGIRVKARPIALSVANDGVLPIEFRLFTNGWNTSEKGPALFDNVAAKAVMAAHATWGVDLAIDLEHQALGDAGADPTARDARGWCKLELRPDGSLWAVDVKWTSDGAARIQERRQRYISPAFIRDPETSRVMQIVNVALVAIPATHHTPALIAASLTGKGNGPMDPKLIGAALDALIAGDSEKCAELLKGIIAAAAGAEGAEPPGEDVAVAESVTEPPAAGAEAAAEDKKPELAAQSKIVRLTGKPNAAEALLEVEAWRKSHLTLEASQTALAAERATLESAERKRICIELIKLGAEFPSTVWHDDTAVALKAHWVSMPIESLRARAVEQRAARGGKQTPMIPRGAGKAPGNDPDATVKTVNVGNGVLVPLSAREIQIADEAKCDHVTFATIKSRREPTK